MESTMPSNSTTEEKKDAIALKGVPATIFSGNQIQITQKEILIINVNIDNNLINISDGLMLSSYLKLFVFLASCQKQVFHLKIRDLR